MLEREVAALRAEVRAARRRGIAVGAAIGALALLGAKGAPSVVRAERFELTDVDGEVRGVWVTDGRSPSLRMNNGNGGVATVRVIDGTATFALDGELQQELTTVPVEESALVQEAPQV